MASSSFKVLPSTASLGSFNQTAESQEYAVEKILDMKIIDDQVYYLIKWEGYPESESTWEPIEHLTNIINLVEEFRAQRLTKAPLSIPDNLSSIPHEVQKSQYSQKVAKHSQSPLLKELQPEAGTIYKKRKISSQSAHKPSQSQSQSEVMELENSNSQKVSSSEYDLFEAGVMIKGGRSGTTSFDTTNKTFSKPSNSFKTTQEILEGLRKENMLEKTRKSRLLYPDNHKVKKIHLINEDGNTVTDYSYKSSADSDTQQQTRSQTVEGSWGGQVLKSLSHSQDLGQKAKGSLSLHDKPRKIITIKQRKKGAGFWFLVEWEERRNGVKPQNSYVSNEELKENDPKFLLNFYESKIVVFPKNELLDVDNSQDSETTPNQPKSSNETVEEQPKQKKKVILTNSNKKNRKK